MFPIIPYNLNQNSRNMSLSDTGSKLPKVSANCDIPRDTVSEIIKPSSIRGKLENPNVQLQVGLSEDNLLTLPPTTRFPTVLHWIRCIRLADDCHGYNARLCYQKPVNDFQNYNFIIQITRPIKTGQELLLWFSEDVLANLQMAFLTPANIQGQKKYVCHLCATTFEYPNPLKLHLTLDCNRQHISTIWDRLYKSVSPSNTESSTSFGFQLKMIESKYSILNLSKSPVSTPDLVIQRPVSEPSTMHSSAFKPYATSNKIRQNNNSIRLSQSVTSLPVYQSHPSLLVPNSFSNSVDLDHAAQMETLVSNLGKSKQGHLCIYCGKCYSRKYGLKIHIRTHTGYKPLKCKFCLRPFGDPSNLNKHVRLHAEGDTPYKCELCGKVLVRRRDLERHLRSRHMEEMHLGEKVVVEEHVSSSDHSDD